MSELSTSWKNYLMFNYDYKVFADIAFWVVIGIMQALAVTMVVFGIAKIIVNKIFDFFNPVQKLVFKKLPDHITSMQLSYDKKLKTITAVATVKNGPNVTTRTYTVVVPNKKQLPSYATNVQLQLMTNIAKELNLVN